MTVKETSKKIGVSASKLYQLVAAHRIAHYRVDGKIIFSEGDISAFLAGCRVGAVTPAVAAPRMHPKLKHLTLRP